MARLTFLGKEIEPLDGFEEQNELVWFWGQWVFCKMAFWGWVPALGQGWVEVGAGPCKSA